MFKKIFGTFGAKIETRSYNELMLDKLESISKSCGFMCAIVQLIVAYVGLHWIGIF